jgi:hypothetical protein
MREKITTKEIVSRKADICACYFISQYNFFCIALVPKRSTKWKNENLHRTLGKVKIQTKTKIQTQCQEL